MIRTNSNLQARIGKLIAGTQKHFGNVPNITFSGATYTPQALVQLLQSLADAVTGADAARVQAKDAVLAQRAKKAVVLPVIEEYQTYLVALYGKAAETLADFGLAPRKARKPLTAEQQALANERKDATRKARGTLGSRQKKGIKGNVPAPATGAGSQPATPPTPPVK